MDISKDLKPLLANLKRVEIGKYLHTKNFELYALENNVDLLWNEAKKISTKDKNVFTLSPHNTEEEETVFALLINSLYHNHRDFFKQIIIETILKFCDWSSVPIDTKNIHENLKNLEIFDKKDLLFLVKESRKIRYNKPALIPNIELKKTNIKIDKNKVFIVHGHDENAKTTTARFIEKLGFEAIILHEQASSSKTIIEKIEAYSNVGFAIILYTPCDLGSKNIKEPNLKLRARQNVIFEHGYFIGKIGRENVCALVKGKIETPNDISGVVYITLDESNAWCYSVAKEMKKSGYNVDMNKI